MQMIPLKLAAGHRIRPSRFPLMDANPTGKENVLSQSLREKKKTVHQPVLVQTELPRDGLKEND